MKHTENRAVYVCPTSEQLTLCAADRLLTDSDWVEGGAGSYTDENTYDNGSY